MMLFLARSENKGEHEDVTPQSKPGLSSSGAAAQTEAEKVDNTRTVCSELSCEGPFGSSSTPVVPATEGQRPLAVRLTI